MMYIDANIFTTAAVDGSRTGAWARQLLHKIQAGKVEVATSALTLDEVFWSVQRILGRETALKTGQALLHSPARIAPATRETALDALKLLQTTVLDPRDAFHVATMQRMGIRTIITDDVDFAKIPGLISQSAEDVCKTTDKKEE